MMKKPTPVKAPLSQMLTVLLGSAPEGKHFLPSHRVEDIKSVEQLRDELVSTFHTDVSMMSILNCLKAERDKFKAVPQFNSATMSWMLSWKAVRTNALL